MGVSVALRLGAAVGVLRLISITGIAPAAAHVHVVADTPIRGETAILTFQVPNESETGSPTTEFSVVLPNVESASTDVMAGWESKLEKDLEAGIVRSVTWSALPGAGILADQFEQFQMLVKLPDAETATFPATQTYADGTVVRWDQVAEPGAAEPERPAPTLGLTAGPVTPDQHQPGTESAAPASTPSVPCAPAAEEPQLHADNVARALGGAAVLVAAIGVGVALVRRGA